MRLCYVIASGLELCMTRANVIQNVHKYCTNHEIYKYLYAFHQRVIATMAKDVKDGDPLAYAMICVQWYPKKRAVYCTTQYSGSHDMVDLWSLHWR